METEYSSYRLGLAERRVNWLEFGAGSVAAKEMAQGLGRPGPMTIPTMLRVSWLADSGDKLQRPSRPPSGDLGTLRPKMDALELLATLIAVKLWDSEDRQSSRVALRGFTDNQSNEALVEKAMTTKYPS